MFFVHLSFSFLIIKLPLGGISYRSILELFYLFLEFYQLFPNFINPLEPIILSGILKFSTRVLENFMNLFWDFQFIQEIIRNFIKFHNHLEVS